MNKEEKQEKKKAEPETSLMGFGPGYGDGLGLAE
jgi:hypothetical protein